MSVLGSSRSRNRPRARAHARFVGACTSWLIGAGAGQAADSQLHELAGVQEVFATGEDVFDFGDGSSVIQETCFSRLLALLANSWLQDVIH